MSGEPFVPAIYNKTICPYRISYCTKSLAWFSTVDQLISFRFVVWHCSLHIRWYRTLFLPFCSFMSPYDYPHALANTSCLVHPTSIQLENQCNYSTNWSPANLQHLVATFGLGYSHPTIQSALMQTRSHMLHVHFCDSYVSSTCALWLCTTRGGSARYK